MLRPLVLVRVVRVADLGVVVLVFVLRAQMVERADRLVVVVGHMVMRVRVDDLRMAVLVPHLFVFSFEHAASN
jgi:hypothetical protein